MACRGQSRTLDRDSPNPRSPLPEVLPGAGCAVAVKSRSLVDVCTVSGRLVFAMLQVSDTHGNAAAIVEIQYRLDEVDQDMVTRTYSYAIYRLDC
jgi:hypothetical protein